jgi:hypothetical protein
MKFERLSNARLLITLLTTFHVSSQACDLDAYVKFAKEIYSIRDNAPSSSRYNFDSYVFYEERSAHWKREHDKLPQWKWMNRQALAHKSAVYWEESVKYWGMVLADRQLESSAKILTFMDKRRECLGEVVKKSPDQTQIRAKVSATLSAEKSPAAQYSLDRLEQDLLQLTSN